MTATGAETATPQPPTTQGAQLVPSPAPQTPAKPGRWWVSPVLALLLMSPIVGEVLSGSSPPLEFINPISIFMLLGLYGCGALLVREAVVRWGKGWPSLLALGLAYGVLEEGVMVKSWISPEWMDLGDMAWFGRWGGMNWVWAEMLTLFHAVISIYIAILLVHLLFPGRRHEPWLVGRGLRWVSAWFVGVVAIGIVGFPPFPPPAAQFLFVVMLTLFLVALAWRLPARLPLPARRETPSPSAFVALGAAWSWGLFLGFWSSPSTGLHAAAVMAIMAAHSAVVGLLLVWMSGGGAAWRDRHRLAFAAGVLSFLLFLDVATGIGNPLSLMWLAAIGGALLLWRLDRGTSPAVSVIP